jgi:outer membrane protein assembly factor BamB
MFATDPSISWLGFGNDDIVYVGCPKAIYAFDPEGTLRWKLSGSLSLVQATNGTTYAMGWDSQNVGNVVYSIAPDGKLRRTFARGMLDVTTPAVINDGIVYSGRSGVSAVTLAGDLKWRVSPGQGVTALAIGHDGVIYVGASAPSRRIRDPVTGALKYVVERRVPMVFALDPQTGSTIWSSNAAKGKIFAVKVGSKGIVYIGSFDSNIYALDPHSGAVKWRYSTGSREWGRNSVHALAVGSDGTIYAGSGASVEAITSP